MAIYINRNRINRKVEILIIVLILNIYIFIYLDKEVTSIVYIAELVEILIGLKIAIRANIWKIIVFTNN